MAKVKAEEQLVNAADEEQMTEQQNEPQTLMEQLMQMQKELAEKMAALEAREAAVSEKEQKESGGTGMAAMTVKAPVTSNAWKETRTTFLPRAHAGEENFVLVGVNGQQWKVPRGVPVRCLCLSMSAWRSCSTRRRRRTNTAWSSKRRLRKPRGRSCACADDPIRHRKKRPDTGQEPWAPAPFLLGGHYDKTEWYQTHDHAAGP